MLDDLEFTKLRSKSSVEILINVQSHIQALKDMDLTRDRTRLLGLSSDRPSECSSPIGVAVWTHSESHLLNPALVGAGRKEVQKCSREALRKRNHFQFIFVLELFYG